MGTERERERETGSSERAREREREERERVRERQEEIAREQLLLREGESSISRAAQMDRVSLLRAP